jgi:hypothetical protein
MTISKLKEEARNNFNTKIKSIKKEVRKIIRITNQGKVNMEEENVLFDRINYLTLKIEILELKKERENYKISSIKEDSGKFPLHNFITKITKSIERKYVKLNSLNNN